MSAVAGARTLRFQGPLSALSQAERAELMARGVPAADVRERVAAILADVRARGDQALFELARTLDGATLERLEVPREARQRALASLVPDLRRALERAHDNLIRAHQAQRPVPVEVETEPGVLVGRRPDPLARVGLYAPGGRAAYPSSVLMGAAPARVAGVPELILCSPPGRDGSPAAVVLAAAELAGVDRVFALGGAGAIAAMAYGTRSVPRVERIVGPGNAYVAEAKLQVTGDVGIDAPAGPSELLAIVDATADSEAVALELIAQAEHDPLASAVAVVVGERSAVDLAAALAAAPDTGGAAARSLAARGAVLVADSLEEALEFAAEFAPEHLLLAIADSEAALPRVRNAGAVFLGLASSVTFGDYLTGGNHTLPTGGRARAWSGLSTLDFVRWTSWQRVTPVAAARLAGDVATLAGAEGLPGHAAAARRAGGGR